MTYATINDVIARYKPIASMIGAGSSDVTSVEVASHFIYDAEGIIDGYLAAKYATPLSLVPPLITHIASDLSIHSMLAEKSGNIPEWMDKRYNRAIELLELLRDGEMVLPSSVTVVTCAGDSFAYSSGQGYHPVFSPVLDELDQTPDRQLVERELAERVDDYDVSSA